VKNIKYNLSRDYKKLFRDVNSGLDIVCFIGERQDVCLVLKDWDDGIVFQSRNVNFGRIERRSAKDPATFIRMCQLFELEFIKPVKIWWILRVKIIEFVQWRFLK